MKLLTTFIIGFLFISCSIVNRDSRDHYELKNKLRHGIVPVSVKTDTKTVARRLDDASISRGKELFKKNCTNCHGHDARGKGPMSSNQSSQPKDLVEIAKKVPNFKFYMMVSQWEGGMPGWRSMLSDKDIADIEQYIIHLSKK